ncbi:MAG: hypothetical protein Q9169_006977 [Polycauliona sp. 2 TL-2023]
MRLALQRLLANPDVLRYLRGSLRVSNGLAKLPTAGPCSGCIRRLGHGNVRHHVILKPSQHEPGKYTARKAPRPDAKTTAKKTPRPNPPNHGFAAITVGPSVPASNEADETVNKPRWRSQRRRSLRKEPETVDKQPQSPSSIHRERVIWRLLDETKAPDDSYLWLELAQTRRRVYGITGLRLVWKSMLERGCKLPTAGPAANGLWHCFLELGFEDPDVLEAIFLYARRLKEDHGRVWPKLYAAAVGHYLQHQPDRAWLCHLRLHKHFSPSNRQLRDLFMISPTKEKPRRIFLGMHECFSYARIYDVAIPELCTQGLYATAVTWHKKLIGRGDLPTNAKATEPVLRYLAATGQNGRVMEYARLMVAAGVSFIPYDTKGFIVSPGMPHKLLQMAEDVKNNSPNNGYSDDFCARLMATRFFSIETIIKTLGFLGIREIGPLALRAMATRELGHSPYDRVVEQRLDQLTDAGMSTGDSTFSILLRKFIAEGRSHVLASIVSCDLHTDTFDDHNLQESLLTFYHETSDTTAFERTMAILLVRVPEGLILARRWNLILRSYVCRQKLGAVKSTIERMQNLQVQIEPRSVTHMSQKLLSPRQISRGPAETEEVDLLIRIWQDVLRSGGLVPPWIWTEIFRRLGMSGSLVMFERLALWLAAWYSSPTYRTSLSCLLTQNKGDSEPLHPGMTIDMNPNNPMHPLHIIFPPKLQQAIIAWGFQHTFPGLAKSVTHGRRPDWTWGLALLRKLHDSKVYIRQQTVSKAFKLRLIGLFGPGQSKRKINRLARRRNREGLVGYIGRSREVWGADLLRKDQRRIRGREEKSGIRGSECRGTSLKMFCSAGYGKRGRENIAVLMQQLHVSSPTKSVIKNDKNAAGRCDREPRLLIDPIREPLAPVTINAQQEKKSSAKKQTRTRKPKRQSLLPCEQHPIQTADMGNGISKHLQPLLKLNDVNAEVLNFESWAATWSGSCRFNKIAQGAFGAVFRIESKTQPGTFTIGKLIPLQSKSGWGCKTREFTTVRSAANEVFFLSTLDEIDGFVQFRKAEILYGQLPGCLSAASKTFDKMTDDTTQRWQQACAYPKQMWLFIEMSDAGIDLETALKKDRSSRDGSILQGSVGERYLSAVQARDIFWQVASTLAVAEKKLEFEHRDLHLGNICLSYPQTEVLAEQCSELWTDRPSINVTLIDYTLSRARPTGSETVFNDLTAHPDIFTGKGHPQYDVYRKMKTLADQRDEKWEGYMPSTNVLWLSHVLELLLQHATLSQQLPEHLQLWHDLEELRLQLGGVRCLFANAQEVVVRCEMETAEWRSLCGSAGSKDTAKQPFEITCSKIMDRVRKALKSQRPRSPSYEPLNAEANGFGGDGSNSDDTHRPQSSWLDYAIFLLLGASMLWAWNMFLAASPYFQQRFSSSPYLLTHFPAYITSISAVTNLAFSTLLARLQQTASYPQRIIAALFLNIVGFTLLAMSTTLFRSITVQGYFAFLMVVVFTASLATGLCQNGTFAYVAGFGVPEYTQAIMTGQAIAGVLPCIAQIVSVLSVSEEDAPQSGVAHQSSKSAFAYFLTATAVSMFTLVAFLYLLRSQKNGHKLIETAEGLDNAQETEAAERKVVSLWTLFKKLRYLSSAVFLCFGTTMLFPIFTQAILSVRDQSTAPRLFQPACFIPLAFLMWNTGDLLGRLLTGIPQLALMHWPRTLLFLSALRVVFIPLYLLCNLHGQGAAIKSDAFYLIVVQLLFGLTNGYIGSSCMMGVGEWVENEEREAAGGFMSLMLVGGMTIGSFLSFLAA